MTQKMTRKRALELATTAINQQMAYLHNDAMYAIDRPNDEFLQRRAERYAELAAALAMIEHMARQKELI